MNIVRLGCYTSSPLFSLSVYIRHNFSPPVFGPNCVPERNHLSRLPRVVVPFQCSCCCFDSYHHLLGSLVFSPSYIFVFTTMIDDTRPPIAFSFFFPPKKLSLQSHERMFPQLCVLGIPKVYLRESFRYRGGVNLSTGNQLRLLKGQIEP